MPRRRASCPTGVMPLAFVAAALSAAVGSCSGAVGDPDAQGASAGTTATGVVGGGSSSMGGTGGTTSTGWGGTTTVAGGSGGAGSGMGGAATGGSAGTGGAGSPPLECAATGPLDCSASSPASYDCDGVNNTFQQQVNAAVASVRDANPSWFDYDAGPAPCCPLALQPAAFRDAVVDYINAHGLCAAPDPNNAERELAVKLNSDCNEGYLILTSQWIVRSPAHHSYTCEPAWM